MERGSRVPPRPGPGRRLLDRPDRLADPAEAGELPHPAQEDDDGQVDDHHHRPQQHGAPARPVEGVDRAMISTTENMNAPRIVASASCAGRSPVHGVVARRVTPDDAAPRALTGTVSEKAVTVSIAEARMLRTGPKASASALRARSSSARNWKRHASRAVGTRPTQSSAARTRPDGGFGTGSAATRRDGPHALAGSRSPPSPGSAARPSRRRTRVATRPAAPRRSARTAPWRPRRPARAAARRRRRTSA